MNLQTFRQHVRHNMVLSKSGARPQPKVSNTTHKASLPVLHICGCYNCCFISVLFGIYC